MSICIIFNPAARSEKAQKFRKVLERLPSGWVLKPTTGPGRARMLATEAVHEGHETVVAAGGDGTLNEVLNGLADAPNGLARARLGVMPVGTVNVFAREIQMPLKLEKVWPVLEAGKETRIDLGRAEFQNGNMREVRHFVQLAGAGFDSRVIERVTWEAKRKHGPFAYLFEGLRALGVAGPMVTISNGMETQSGELIRVGNGRLYGGNVPFLHRADLRDGVLDAAIFPHMNWRMFPGHVWDIATRRMFEEGGSIYMTGREFDLTSDRPTSLQLDGELAGQLPAKLTVVPQALRIVWPGP